MALIQTSPDAICGPASGPNAGDDPGALSPIAFATSAKRSSSASSRVAKPSVLPLPPASAVAIAWKLEDAPYRVFTLLGDGELAEGSNWEAAMTAAHYELDNLTAIVDHNTLQITGRTREVLSNEPLDEKFKAFGWAVRKVDGHDVAALTEALRAPLEAGKPGCKNMPANNDSHSNLSRKQANSNVQKRNNP